MATRWYLPETGTAAVSPSFSSYWTDTSAALRRPLREGNQGTTITDMVFTDADATAKVILFRQYVSDPLNAQTIAAQTLSATIREVQVALTNNMKTTMAARLVKEDGTDYGTVKTLLTSATKSTEMPTAAAGGFLSGATTSQDAAAGDRIVFEIGATGDPDAGSDHDCTLTFGESAATWLVSTSTTSNNPWMQFSGAPVSFQKPYTFWFPATEAADVTPSAYDTIWDDTSLGIVRKLQATFTTDSDSSTAFTDADNTLKDIFFRQYVSGPLAAQTLVAQTIRLVRSGLEANTGNNMFLRCVGRVVNGDGTNKSPVATLFDIQNATEFSTTRLKRSSTVTSTERTLASGDRVVIEFGNTGDPTGSNTHSSTLYFGISSATVNLIHDDVTSDASTGNSWIQFGFPVELSAGGTTFYETPTMTAVGTATLVNRIGMIRTFAGTGTETLVKQAGLIRTFSGTGTETVLKQPNMLLVYAGVGTSLMTKAWTMVTTLVMTAVGAASLTKANIWAKVLTYTGTGASTLVNQIQKTLASTGTGTAALSRVITYVLAYAGTGTASVLKQVQMLLLYSGVGTLVFSKLKVIILGTFNSTATGTATLVKQVGKILLASGVGASALVRQIKYVLTYAGTGTATLTKSLTARLSLLSTAVGTAVLTKAITFVQLLQMTGLGTSSLLKQIRMSFLYAGVGAATLLKRVNILLISAATGTATLTKGLLFIVTKTFSGVGTLVFDKSVTYADVTYKIVTKFVHQITQKIVQSIENWLGL